MEGTLFVKHTLIPGLWSERRAVLRESTLLLSKPSSSLFGVFDAKAQTGGQVARVMMVSGERGKGKRPHRFDVMFAGSGVGADGAGHLVCFCAAGAEQLRAWLEALQACGVTVLPVPAAPPASGAGHTGSTGSAGSAGLSNTEPTTSPLQPDSSSSSSSSSSDAAAAAAAAAEDGPNLGAMPDDNLGDIEIDDDDDDRRAAAARWAWATSDFADPPCCILVLFLVPACRLAFYAALALALRCQRAGYATKDASCSALHGAGRSVSGGVIHHERSWEVAVLPALLGLCLSALAHGRGVCRVALARRRQGRRGGRGFVSRRPGAHAAHRAFLFGHVAGAVADVGLGATLGVLVLGGWFDGSNGASWRLHAGWPLWAAGLLSTLLQWRVLVPLPARGVRGAANDGGCCGRGAAVCVARLLRALLHRGAALCLVPFLVAWKLDEPVLAPWLAILAPLGAACAALLLGCPALWLRMRRVRSGADGSGLGGSAKVGRRQTLSDALAAAALRRQRLAERQACRERFGGTRGGPGLALLALSGLVGLAGTYALAKRLDDGWSALPWSVLELVPGVARGEDAADLLVLGPLAVLALIEAALACLAARGAHRQQRARRAKADRNTGGMPNEEEVHDRRGTAVSLLPSAGASGVNSTDLVTDYETTLV